MRAANLSLQDYCVQRQELRLLSQWDREENAPLITENVSHGSHKKIWWRCEQGHRWQAAVYARTGGSGCSYCTGKRVVPGENDLAGRFPQIASQWHPTRNGTKKPESVTAFSNLRAWWVCNMGHEYLCVVAHRTQSAVGCPYCAGRKVLTGFNDLETKNPQVAAQWDGERNGALTPRMITAGSHKKV